jgi:multidrug efflux system membrane fusion protein
MVRCGKNITGWGSGPEQMTMRLFRPAFLNITPMPYMFGLYLAAAVAAGAAGWPLAARAQTPGNAIPVTTVAVARRDVPVILRNIGAVQAFQSVLVRARVDGTIDKVWFEEGQDVKPGDKLVQIDPRPYAATLAAQQAKKASDQAQLVNAQRDLARYTSLARSDFASHQQMDTQSAMVAQLTATIQGDDAAIATAQLNLDFTNIRSPIAGRTGLRMVDAGNLVHATDVTGLVTITQLHPIAMIFTLPQDNLPAIQAAMAKGKLPVMAYTSDDRTQLGVGELATIDNSIDQSTGTIKLKAVFQNPDSKLWPGQFVNARLQLQTLPNVQTVPSVAVQHGPNGLYSFVVKPDSTVAMAPIEVSQDDGQYAVVNKGLEDGAQVVIAGQSRLQAGTKVAATPAKPTT